MIALRVDIDLHGAFAVLEDDRLIAVHDMPCLNEKPQQRRSINPPFPAAAPMFLCGS
jgi:hypothetical protein